MVTGGWIVAETLARLGAGPIFSVSGNQILPIYDALPEAGPRLYHLRHESAAAYAAAAWAELMDRPGVALVSAGPGFLASLTGVAVARSMELPLLLLSGAAPAALRGRGAFQDLDQTSAALVACKASFDAGTFDGIAPALAAAWDLARAGVPGPVHVGLPADALLARGEPPSPLSSAGREPLDAPTLDALRAMAARLARAERPVVIARPSAARGPAGLALAAIHAQLGAALIVSGAPRALSDLKFAETVRALPDADVALVIAPADFAAGFLDDALLPGATLLLDAPGDPEPARLPALRCQLAPGDALPLLAELLLATTSVVDPAWTARLATRDPLPAAMDDADGLHPLTVAAALRAALGPRDVVALDGGEFCQWVRLGLRDLPNPMLWNGKLGAIGGSVAQALGAAVAMGETARVVAVLGDGAAGYHLSELETAAREGLPIVAVVGNDARWAAEWHQQIARYGPERAFHTRLLPARYDLAGVGYGADGVDVADATALRDALELALTGACPSCLNVHVRSLPSPAVVA